MKLTDFMKTAQEIYNQFDTFFELPSAKLVEVLKGSSIATDSDKLYLYTKDKKVYFIYK